MALLGIIRRWHLRDQISLREIAKRLGISRNTVRRYLRSETVEPAYADRRSASALDVYTFKLSAWLKTESTKSRKQKRSLKQMHADLCVLGFEGSYDRVAAFARQWKVDQLDRVNAASKGTTMELKDRKIRVNSMSPGPIETQALEKAGLTAEQAAQAAAQFAEQVPLGRRGKPEEVAAVVLFLASDESSYITEVDLAVDGGDGAGLN